MRRELIVLLAVLSVALNAQNISTGLKSLTKAVEREAEEFTEEGIEFVRDTRSKQFYDDCEMAIRNKTALIFDDPKLKYYEDNIVLRIFVLGIMKPILLERRTPSAMDIRKMAHDLAKIVRENITDDVIEAAAGTMWIMSEKTVEKVVRVAMKVTQPNYVAPVSKRDDQDFSGKAFRSNSSFVTELAIDGIDDTRSILVYYYSGATRCIADHAGEAWPSSSRLTSLNEEAIMKVSHKIGERCGDWLFSSLLVTSLALPDDEGNLPLLSQIALHELLETLSDDDNVEEILKAFVTFLETITKRSSYDSLEAFFGSLSRSPILRVAIRLLGEDARCQTPMWKPGLDAAIKAVTRAMGGVGRQLLPLDANIDERAVRTEVIAFLRAIDSLQKEVEKPDAVAFNMSQYTSCMFPKAGRQSARLVDALKGSDSERERFLDGLKTRYPSWHAIYEAVFYQIKLLRRRHGLSENAKSFFNKAVVYVASVLNTYELRESNTAEEGGAARERLTREIRNAYRTLPLADKKALIKHYPYASLYLLAKIF